MDYVLIIITFAGGMSGGASTTYVPGFETLAQCEFAASQNRMEFAKSRIANGSFVVATCNPRGVK